MKSDVDNRGRLLSSSLSMTEPALVCITTCLSKPVEGIGEIVSGPVAKLEFVHFYKHTIEQSKLANVVTGSTDAA